MNRWVIAMVMMFILFVLGLAAAEKIAPAGQTRVFVVPAVTTPSVLYQINPEAEFAAAQATLVAGQRELGELSHQATLASLYSDQAANAAAQSTALYHQSQLLALSYQVTAVSLQMEQALATQQAIARQTEVARSALSTAGSQAATATYSTYMFYILKTAQAQTVLDAQSTQTAQAMAARTAQSLTATPWAALQAEIVRSSSEAGRRALWDEFVVTPTKVILLTLAALLLIAGAVNAYQRLMPVLELRLRTISPHTSSPYLLVDGTLSAPGRPHTPGDSLQAYLSQLASSSTAQVEIISSSEPSITNWITEAEAQLPAAGRTTAGRTTTGRTTTGRTPQP
jgi:hypothetical protein